SVSNEILGDARVAREHDGATAVVHAKAKRWPDRRVINLEGRDRQSALLEDHSLIHVLGKDNGTVGRSPVVIQPDPDVEVIAQLEMRHHPFRSPWPPDKEWPVATLAYEPACQPEIGKAYDVIRMMVCQE